MYRPRFILVLVHRCSTPLLPHATRTLPATQPYDSYTRSLIPHFRLTQPVFNLSTPRPTHTEQASNAYCNPTNQSLISIHASHLLTSPRLSYIHYFSSPLIPLHTHQSAPSYRPTPHHPTATVTLAPLPSSTLQRQPSFAEAPSLPYTKLQAPTCSKTVALPSCGWLQYLFSKRRRVLPPIVPPHSSSLGTRSPG